MTQLASEFSSSYSAFITGGHFRNALAPYYAPGIGFNSIKSGLAVDYPIIEPHKDRNYNQYAVMFQSASLAIDENFGNANGAGPHSNGTRSDGTPLIAGAASTSPKLSRNRVEIGKPADWAKVISGSLAPGGSGVSGKAITVSLWMYFPKVYSGHGSIDGHSPTSIGLYRQKGNIISFGGSRRNNGPFDLYWRGGVNFGYFIGVDSMGGNFDRRTYDANLSVAGHNSSLMVGKGFTNDRMYTIGFTCSGGDGITNTGLSDGFFSFIRVSNAYNSTEDLKAIHPGWNHILLSLELDNIGISFAGPGNTNGSVKGFNAWVNGERYTGAGVIKCTSDYFNNGQSNFTNTSYPVLDEGNKTAGENEDFVCIGQNAKAVEYYNSVATGSLLSPTHRHINSTALHLEDYIFDDGTIDGTNSAHTSKLNTYTNARTVDGNAIDISDNIMNDFVYPGENMMSEVIILNTPGTDQMARTLSGYVNGTPDFRGMIPKVSPFVLGQSDNQEWQDLRFFDTIGDTLGPRNPYTCLPSTQHNRIIGWYRMGGDSGYTNHAINKMHMFNHAQDLFSGKILNNTTGSAVAFNQYDMPTKDNHLSGAFYGFTEWSGSLTNDLKYSNKKRQRWNGIVDITNPSQYTCKYTAGNADYGTYVDPGVNDYRTWYGSIGTSIYFEDTTTTPEKLLVDNNKI